MENNETKQPQGKTYDGGVTEEQINKWKAVHKRVIRIDVTDGEDLHVAYFKRPVAGNHVGRYKGRQERRGEKCLRAL